MNESSPAENDPVLAETNYTANVIFNTRNVVQRHVARYVLSFGLNNKAHIIQFSAAKLNFAAWYPVFRLFSD